MDKPIWIVIGPADYDRGHPVFGPFRTRQDAEKFADEQHEEATRRLHEEFDDLDEDEESEEEWEVTILLSPEG
jgi:hypothetical protein